MKLQIKLWKTGEITNLQAKKQSARYRLTYLDCSKKEKKYDSCFEGQSTAWNVNATLYRLETKKWRVLGLFRMETPTA